MTPELTKKVDRAIKLLQSIPQDTKIELCYSTGKDSDVILELAKMSGIPFEPIYKNTTCDLKGSIAHAREMGVRIVQPKQTFLQLIEKKGLPSRFVRFCCEVLKEYKIYDRAILGIRRDESSARAKRYLEPERCYYYKKNEKARHYFPILDWTIQDEEEFIKERGLKLHPHYYNENGELDLTRRVGCIGCPLASGNGKNELKEYPLVLKGRVKAYIKWWNTHPNSRARVLFPTPYNAVFYNLFCRDMKQYNAMWGDGLFENKKDAKTFLEEYFNVKLD